MVLAQAESIAAGAAEARAAVVDNLANWGLGQGQAASGLLKNLGLPDLVSQTILKPLTSSREGRRRACAHVRARACPCVSV